MGLEINKAKKKIQHQQQKEVDNLFGKKLKKTDTVRSTWKAAEVERVHLKHHEFEPFPQDNQVEQCTGVQSGKSIHTNLDENKNKKKIILRKPKSHETEEEVTECIEFSLDLPNCTSE